MAASERGAAAYEITWAHEDSDALAQTETGRRWQPDGNKCTSCK